MCMVFKEGALLHIVIALLRLFGDPSHNQPPNADTIAYTSKILLKGPRYSCLLWDYASASQTQKWMITVSYWMDQRAPNGGARESTQGAKGNCNPIGGTTIWSNQKPPPPPPGAHVSSCICIRRWPSLPSVEKEAHCWCKLYMPLGTPGPRSDSGWVGGGGSVWGTFGIALEM